MLISTITSNISFIQLSLMHRITEKICKERWQHWCTKISGVKVLPTLLISTITSNMSFIQLSLMLSGYPASSFVITVYEKDYVGDLPTGAFVCSFCFATDTVFTLFLTHSAQLQNAVSLQCSTGWTLRWQVPGGGHPTRARGGLARPTFQRKFAEADSESEMSSSDEGTGSAHTGNLNNARSLSMNNATPLQSCGFRCHGLTSFYTRQGQGFFWPESRQRPIWWHRNDNCFVFEDGSSVHVVSWIFF